MRADPEMQRPEVLSEAHPEPLLAAMTEEHWGAARLSTVAEAAQDLSREVLSEAHFEPLLVAMTGEHWAAARLPAVGAEAAQDVPREAAEVRDELLAAEAAHDAPREAAEVPDELRAVVAEAVQDELLAEQDELRAVVAEAEQDGLLAAEAARDEPQAGAQPSVAEPSVAPQALSLLAARLARQHKTLRLRGPDVMTFEGSRSQSLLAGSIEFVSWRPVREKESNNVSFVSNDQLIIVRRQCGEARSLSFILLIATENLIWE